MELHIIASSPIERPEELNKFLEKAVDQIWDLIFKLSTENIETVKLEELKERDNLESDNKNLIESNQSLLKTNFELDMNIEALNKKSIDKDKEIAALNMKIQMLIEQSEADNKKYFTLLDKFQNQESKEIDVKTKK